MISRAIDVRPRAERPLPREFRPDSGRCKPAIDTFRVEGHSCGIQIAALMDLSSAGVQFDMSPEIRTGLLKAGIHTAAGPRDSPRNDQ